MPIDLEAETRSNSKDIHALTVTVTRVVTMQENAVRQRDSDADMMKTALAGIEQLANRMNSFLSMEKDIKSLAEALSTLSGDTRANRHDVQNALNALNGIPILNDKISENARIIASHGAKLEAIESWRDKADGAFSATRTMAIAFWSMFGTSIIGGVAYLIHFLAGRP